MKEAEKIIELLDKAVAESCEPQTGVVFSAGLDSTIITILASKHAKVKAYCCGTPNSQDLIYARECINLGFEIVTIEINEEEIEESLKKIVAAIKDHNPTKVAVEVPFYFASKKAREDGIKVMLCGQGSDELFGGYSRYIESIIEGTDTVASMMQYDVENINKTQLDKDKTVCRINDVELRAPYLDKELMAYVKSLSIELKIKESREYRCFDKVEDKNYVRKYILREAGKIIGVPEVILNRPKKAAQYGSGTQKAIEQIAKKRGYKEKAKKAGRKDYIKMFLEEQQQLP